MTELDKVKDDLLEIMGEENASAIITTLKLNSPLNLKSISDLLGKAESTLHRHMSKLRKKNFIVQDTSVDQPGKYYKLAPEVEHYYNKRMATVVEDYHQEIEEFLELEKKANQGNSSESEEAKAELYNRMMESYDGIFERKEGIEASFTVNKNIQSLVLQQIIKMGDDNDQISKENIIQFINDPSFLGILNSISTTIEVASRDHVMRILDSITGLIETIADIENEVIEMKKNNPDLKTHKRYTYIFSSSLMLDDN